MKKQLILGLACLMFVLAGTGILFAQTATTGQIVGNIADPSGALIPGAKVTLTGDNGVQRTDTSDAAGHYLFALLPPGNYSLQIDATGFATAKVNAVAVRITETTPVNLNLKLKSAGEQTVEVTAAPPLVQAENATNGRVIEQATIRQLPLPTRNFQQLLTLTPGTTGSIANSSELGRGDAVVSVNGQRTTSNSIVINGMDSAAIGTGGTPNLAVPATDSMQEFVVQTSLFDATTGRNAGGSIAAVTKSGTNQIHGNAYGFFRDDSLNANNFFLKQAKIPRPDYNRKQFGGTLGGPIKRDKLWFFTSYQGTRETNGTSLTNSLSTVSVPGCLTNDRSDAALALLTGPTTLGGCGLSAVPGLLGLNSVAKTILQAKLANGSYLIPSASAPTPGVKTAQAVTIPTTSKFQEDQFNTNLDYQVSANNRIYGKFFWADNPTTQGLYSFAGVQNALQAPGAPTDLMLKNRVLTVGDMHVFSPSLINDFKAGGNFITVDSNPKQPFTSAGWGITNPLASQFPGAPTISISNNIDLNSSPLASNFSQNKTYTFNDMLTWTKGKHNFKFGGEFKHNESNLRFDAYNNGQLIYSSYELFFNGFPTLSILGSGDRFREIRANDFSLFAQDDWRVNSRLTINLGLRWDVYGPFTEAKGRFVAFDTRLAKVTGGVVTAGFVQAGNGNVAGIPKVQDGLVDRDLNNLGPRIGFAFKPLASTDKIVVRGGYGVYYDRLNARSFNSQVFNPPYYLVGLNLSNFTSVTVDPANPYVQVPAMNAFPIPFNNTTYFPLGGPPFQLQVPYRTNLFVPATMHTAFAPVNGIYPDRADFRTPYIQQYSLGIQSEIHKDLLLDVSYVGAVSRKLTRMRNINQGSAAGSIVGQYSIGMSGLASAPLGTFVQQTGANASYNSLQASLTKRYSNGLQFLASYTWSHAIDDYSGTAVNDLTAVFGDTHKDYVASSDFDRTHRFIVSAVYDLPKFYKGGNGFGKRVVNDWELATIGTWQSGIPFSIVTDASAFNNAYASLAAGRTVQSAVKSGDTISRLNSYFDTTAFVPACNGTTCAAGDFGNVPRNPMRGPGQSNLDFSIVKFIPVTEHQRIEFRTEFFNIFNHTNFANPVSVKGTSAAPNANFGKILSTSTGPRVIQFAFKYNF